MKRALAIVSLALAVYLSNGALAPSSLRAQPEGAKSFIKIVSNEKDIEACLVSTIRERGAGLWITSNLFDVPEGPYAELITLCEHRRPLVRDRAGRILVTQDIHVCSTTIDAYPGLDFWRSNGIPKDRLKAVAKLSERILSLPAAGTPTSLCEEIGLEAGKRLYKWLID